MANIWKTDTCDSCQRFKLTKRYLLNAELFVWCNGCADPDATEQELI